MNRIAIAKNAATALLALIIGSASAQQAGMQSYDVELVVFRNLSSNATNEDWSKALGATSQNVTPGDDEEAASGAAIEVAPPATATESFPALPAGKMKLGAIAEQLKRSRGYQTVAHFGWTQPGFPRTEAHYMSIDSKIGAETGLTGRVALSRGRYLHLTLDLTLQPAGSGESYVLRQTRRMRSNERHYIDHPKFGVIALITQSESQ
ncbi:CsiV family protein [Povalibacter sp.]|uniref:CsiV family protein n=1 Tax=Povalibacter sp. TaxID=1962978 RepID=UPI002F42C7FE